MTEAGATGPRGGHAWAIAIAAALALAIVAGGSAQAASPAYMGFRLLCLGLLAAGLYRLRGHRLNRGETVAALLVMAAGGLVLLHLAPLPFAVFAALPGRTLAADILTAVGQASGSMPASLDPAQTWGALLALLAPAGLFVATLSLPARERLIPIVTLLAVTAVATVLGLLQRFQGANSPLYLYDFVNAGSATGFFANRNHQASLLAAMLPLTWAAAHRLRQAHPAQDRLILSAAGVMAVAAVTGLAVTNSRAGILLGMLSLLLTCILAWPPAAGSHRATRRRSALAAMVTGTLLIGQFGMVGILRVTGTDPLTEYRGDIAAVSLTSAAEYYPVGSGFGTFRQVYGMHEPPATMIDAYVNHAHNDWLELWLEGGVPAAVLMAVAVALAATQGARLWRPRAPALTVTEQRAASIALLVLLLHSAVDYPLRTPALASLFGFLAAVFLSGPVNEHRRGRSRRPHAGASPREAVTAQPPRFTVPPAYAAPTDRFR